MEVEVQQRLGQLRVEVTDSSYVGEARRTAVQCAETAGMEESDRGAVAIASTELASNLVKHASRGKLLFETLRQNGTSGIRLLCLDQGPGISDITAALQDGYSTSGTAGNGLGAVRRLATRFDLYSAPGHGTCVFAEFWPKKKSPGECAFVVGVISQAIRGETVCGDGWGSKCTADRSLFMVADGLGHGAMAAEAAREAERVVAQADSNSLAIIIRDCHDALKKTRGAAVAMAAIAKDLGTLSFAGVGNISATLLHEHGRRGLASHNGTLGHQMHRIQEFNVPWNADSLLVMHSDGLGSKWDLNEYPGLARKHPSIIAAVLYRDFSRERDDVTVMVVKNSD
jgi:anti-sigma regulatory factor (Ser/Thr protein kinase)